MPSKPNPILGIAFVLFATLSLQAQDPEILAPGVISTELGERDASFHPDGTELYFTLWTGRFGTIVMSKMDSGSWGSPETVSFSGRHNDLEPFVTPDGSRLYFASKRPLPGETTSGDFNLWFAERDGDGWGEPEPLDDVNTDANEFYPSLDRGGNLFWTGAYETSEGGEDIWYATPSDTGFSMPINVGQGVNTEHDEFNSMISPDGSWLAFGSFGRDDGMGGGDLYISFKQVDGSFGTAINMGSRVNTSALDFCPSLTPDGSTFVFTSRRTDLAEESDKQRTYKSLTDILRSPENGAGDLYQLPAAFIEELRKQASR
jgi:hypothetical protein